MESISPPLKSVLASDLPTACNENNSVPFLSLGLEGPYSLPPVFSHRGLYLSREQAQASLETERPRRPELCSLIQSHSGQDIPQLNHQLTKDIWVSVVQKSSQWVERMFIILCHWAPHVCV